MSNAQRLAAMCESGSEQAHRVLAGPAFARAMSQIAEAVNRAHDARTAAYVKFAREVTANRRAATRVTR